MTDETDTGYKSRKMLQEELDAKNVQFSELMARIAALESKPDMATALKEDREAALSAKLQRELDEARAQIEHLKRPNSPSSGVPYSGWAQAKEDLWDGKLIRRGPSAEGPGEYFEISLPDYWPGCPFTPVIRHTNKDGSAYFTPHPDFASH